MTPNSSYGLAPGIGQVAGWRVADIIGGDKRLDFARPFLPEPLAGTAVLGFLAPAERLVLNQIRGHAYLHLFALCESFILPFALDYARPQLQDEPGRVRTLLQFASEEAKHLQLFRRFRKAFAEGFGCPCGTVGPVRALAQAVLAHHPLAVALITLHIEWMTQTHYLEAVQDDEALDPLFKSLLKHHWIEESRHAELDAQMVRALAESCGPLEIAGAIDEYFAIVALLGEALERQVGLDLESFERATGRALDPGERATFLAAQARACRRAFLAAGMTHPQVADAFASLQPGAAVRLGAAAERLS